MENVIGGLGCSNSQIPNQAIGALRCEVLAVLVGNSLFSREEQLRANHNAHECECPQRLAVWLRNVRREAQRRERVAKLRQQVGQQPMHCDKATQETEFESLLQNSLWSERDKRAYGYVFPKVSDRNRVTYLGDIYFAILDRLGKLEAVRN